MATHQFRFLFLLLLTPAFCLAQLIEARLARPHCAVKRGDAKAQRLAGSGRRGDERMPPGADLWPSEKLRLGRLAEGFLAPTVGAVRAVPSPGSTTMLACVMGEK